ncbi:TOBE domain-containing protein, partial [Enterobacter hormaechei]|nr:TOBE domain-containing protein [Enterobacter hormaechei]
FGFAENTDDLFVGKTLLHGDVLMWLMKTLLTSGCTNQRGAGHNGQVEVQLEVGNRTLWARISPWARDELGIKPGLWLYAQIKSVSITA